MGVHIKTLEINGQSFRIEVDGVGEFTAVVDDERIGAKTLSELTEKLTKISRRKVQPVPFCRIVGGPEKGYTLKEGVITKRNIRTRNIMVKIDGKTDQEFARSSGDRMYIRPLNEDEKLIYSNLYLTLQKAQNAISTFEKSRILDVPEALGEKE